MRFAAFTLIALSCSSQAYAQPLCPEGAASSYKAILACAESRSPEIQNAELDLRRAESQVSAAGQWQNPEFSAEAFQREEGGVKQGETDISLGIPIEIGKISSRKAVAQGGVGVAQAKLIEAKAKARIETLLKLHRLRQVLHEKSIIEEAIQTFSKLVKQYASRPSLSPEQQVSSSVYRLSNSEYELKKSENNEEILSLDSYFRNTTGLSVDQIKKVLPESPKNWPKVPDSAGVKDSPAIRALKAERDSANADLSLANSDAWPTLTIGPSLKIENNGNRSDKYWGLNVGFPLPIFSLNGGQRATATAGLQLSETKLELGLRGQTLKRAELTQVYEQSVKTLSESISHQEIEKRHGDAEKLFSRGIIPSALVIEAHRTSYELERNRHERELKALEALLGIYTMDGNILEVSL